MVNESEGDPEQENLKEGVSERAHKALKGSSTVSESRFGVDYPIRNYRLSPREVKIVIDLLSSARTDPSYFPSTEVNYSRIAESLQKQLDRWMEYYLECEEARNKDAPTAGI